MHFIILLCFSIAVSASTTNAQDIDCKHPPVHLHPDHCCEMPRTRDRFMECAEKFHRSAPPHHMHTGFQNHGPPGFRNHHGQPGFQNQGFGFNNQGPIYQNSESGFVQRFRRQATTQPPTDEQCFVDCLLNTTNIVQDDTIDRQKAITSMENIFQDTEWSPAIATAVDACIDHINQFKSHIETVPKHPETKCSNFGKFFVGCLNRHLLANCPASIWNNNDDCNLVKTYIQTCDGSEMLKGGKHRN